MTAGGVTVDDASGAVGRADGGGPGAATDAPPTMFAATLGGISAGTVGPGTGPTGSEGSGFSGPAPGSLVFNFDDSATETLETPMSSRAVRFYVNVIIAYS